MPAPCWPACCSGAILSQPRAVRFAPGTGKPRPHFVKFGQVLSTRRDILPPDLADELAKLQDRVPPIAPEQARAVLIGAYGEAPEQVFHKFDPTQSPAHPVAQVHFAELPDGKGSRHQSSPRPGILPIIEQDLALLRAMAGLVERLFADGKRLKPREWWPSSTPYLHDELDLGREAANASQLRRNFLNSHMLLVPEIYWDWCRHDVMVMQRMYGTPLVRSTKLLADGIDQATGTLLGDFLHPGIPRRLLSRRHAPRQHHGCSRWPILHSISASSAPSPTTTSIIWQSTFSPFQSRLQRVASAIY